MDQMIVCVMAMVGLRWWASVPFHPVQRISAWRQVSDGLYTIQYALGSLRRVERQHRWEEQWLCAKSYTGGFGHD